MKLGDLLHVLLKEGSLKSITAPDRAALTVTTTADTRTRSSAEKWDFPIDITCVHYNSKLIKPGGLFVAIPGFRTDGHRYIHDAVERGASAVITQKPYDCRAVNIQVADTRKALAAVSDAFYGHPSSKLHITGITGTNGKTTTAYIFENILLSAGRHVGVIGTVNYRYHDKIFNNPVTTPESMDLQRILAEMAMQGITHVVMEVSSHAVDLFRIDFTAFDMGVFTNFTQDHLDYHGDMASYWHCKKKFFTHHLNAPRSDKNAVAVINIDNDKGRELLADIPYTCFTVGRDRHSMVKPREVRIDLSGIRGEITTPRGGFAFKSPLIGSYNLENILCAAGAGAALNLPTDTIKAGIEKTILVPGRLERVISDSGKSVYVDYAHTPDALQNVLRALKRLKPKRTICIFGCGGDRDKAKRASMGEIAAGLCDLVIITSDNPRTEHPAAIIDQILVGVKRILSKEFRKSDFAKELDQKGFIVEQDRKNAIHIGIAAAEPGDIVLIAGKGHETYQIIGRRQIPFDDRIVAENALADESATYENPKAFAEVSEGNH